MWICEKCGTENLEDANYCMKCGRAKIKKGKTFNKRPLTIVAIVVVLLIAITATAFSLKDSKPISENPYRDGLRYYYGEGVPMNHEEALKYFKLAAKDNNADAMHYIGVIYYNGLSVEKNYSEARKWFEKAIENGDDSSAFYIGMMYEYGQGVEVDPVAASGWFLKSAEMGDTFAMEIIADRYADGKGIKKDTEQAIYWYQRAIDEGSSDPFINDKLDKLIEETGTSSQPVSKPEDTVIPVETPEPEDKFPGMTVMASFPEDDVYIVREGNYMESESGDHLYIYRGDKRTRFDFSWFTRHGIEFAETADLDGDNVQEYILACPSASGTGIKIVSLMVFDPQLDGSFKGACLNAEAVQKMMRKETAAGRLGEDYVLLRLNGDKSDHFRRSEAVEFGDGVQLVYGMYGDELYIRMTPVFVYSVQDQIYMYSNEPAEIFSDTAKVWAKGDITANIGYDGENLSLENIEIPGEYVDPMSLT